MGGFNFKDRFILIPNLEQRKFPCFPFDPLKPRLSKTVFLTAAWRTRKWFYTHPPTPKNGLETSNIIFPSLYNIDLILHLK